MIDIGKLKDNMYTFEDNGVTHYCNPLTQGLLIQVSSNELEEEEKVELVFKAMMSDTDYELYKDSPYQVKTILAADYLTWHRRRLEERFPSTDNTES